MKLLGFSASASNSSIFTETHDIKVQLMLHSTSDEYMNIIDELTMQITKRYSSNQFILELT